MGLREDMAATCRETKQRIENEQSTEACGGEVVLTDEHRRDSNGDVQDMLMRASQGCRSGCRCMKVEARIEVRDGVEVVIARCNPDPRYTPFTDPHEH